MPLSADDTRHSEVMQVEKNERLSLVRPGAPTKVGTSELALKYDSDSEATWVFRENAKNILRQEFGVPEHAQ